MRRIFVSLVVLPTLLVLFAAPAAAAPPLKESGTQESLSAFSSTCSAVTCTDTFVDAFTVEEGLVVVCVSQFTYNVRNGRVVSEQSGCSEPSADGLVVTDDLSGSLAETSVTFVTCNQRGCTEGDTVTVSAELTSVGPVFTFTDRGTFSDGTCTFRFRSSGEQSEGTGTLTIDGETLDANGFVAISQFTVSSRCQE
ncbi:MAG TPA: hypothetical protein VF364_11605 [Candidatus Limnocylindria bacterium]